jgi:hypothetical protein
MVNYELGNMRKEAVVACFKAQWRNFSQAALLPGLSQDEAGVLTAEHHVRLHMRNTHYRIRVSDLENECYRLRIVACGIICFATSFHYEINGAPHPRALFPLEIRIRPWKAGWIN